MFYIKLGHVAADKHVVTTEDYVMQVLPLFLVILASCASDRQHRTIFYCEPVRVVCDEFCQPETQHARVCYQQEVSRE